jgi:hypothetical protein
MTLMTINCSTTAATSSPLSRAAPSIACSLRNVQSGVSSILDRTYFPRCANAHRLIGCSSDPDRMAPTSILSLLHTTTIERPTSKRYHNDWYTIEKCLPWPWTDGQRAAQIISQKYNKIEDYLHDKRQKALIELGRSIDPASLMGCQCSKRMNTRWTCCSNILTLRVHRTIPKTSASRKDGKNFVWTRCDDHFFCHYFGHYFVLGSLLCFPL